MPRLLVAYLTALGGILACRSSEPRPTPKSRPAPPAKSASVIGPPSAQPGVTKSQVTSVVERWRAAQEQNDFEAYSAFYAPTFHGIKRAGNKTSRFDRVGWMKDRREMFRKDMKVSVSDVRIFTGQRSAFATFVQDWSTARFHDVGPKRLEFALFAGKLLITSEEMLESKAATAVVGKAPPPGELALLWPLRRGFGAVLKHGPIETRGAARKVVMSKDPSDFLLEKEVTDAATKPFEGLRGRDLDLYDANGVACSANVASFRAIGGFMTWDEREAPDAVWDAMGEPYLVAVVEPEDPKCKPFFARLSHLPKPTVFRPRELTLAESELAALALRKTPTSVATQASYAEYRTANNGLLPDLGIGPGPAKPAQAPAHWDALEPKDWGALAFSHPTMNTTYVVAERYSGTGCDAFGGYALGFFKMATPDWLDLTGNGNPMASFPNRPLFGMKPLAAVALEPSGRLFMVGHDVLYADTGTGFAPFRTIGRMRTTCSC